MDFIEYILLFFIFLMAFCVRDVLLYLWSHKDIRKKMVAVGAGLLTVIAGGAVIFDVPPAGATYYVATTGSDTTGTGTIGNPWKTVQKGIDNAYAGDTVYIRGGTYQPSSAFAMKRSGSAGNPITIKGYPGETAILDGSSVSLTLDYLVRIYAYDYITFDNLTIQDSSAWGIGSYDQQSSHITISYCNIYNIKYNAVVFFITNPASSAIDYITVSHCNFDNIQWGVDLSECVTFRNTAHCLIEYCTMTQMHKICINPSDSDYLIVDHNTIDCSHLTETYDGAQPIGIYVDGGQTDGCAINHVTVSNNTVYNQGEGLGLVGFCNEKGSTITMDDVTFENNLLYSTGSGDVGIVSFLNPGYPANYYSNIVIKHNTMYIPNGYGVKSNLGSGYVSGMVIANNILYCGTQISLSSCTGYTVANNIFYPTDSVTCVGTGHLSDNPLFVTLGSNFHLQSGSPARDAATATYLVTEDIEGIVRPSGAGYDIGAYEYSSWTNTMPTFSGTSPTNGSNNIAKNCKTNITVTDPDLNQTMTVCFYYSTTSITGPWTLAQKNTTAPTRTSPYTYRDMDASYANAYNTKYYWRVTANDGMINKSAAYEFTTLFIYDYLATIHTKGLDYTVWMGGNTTAYYVMKNITGLNTAEEYIALLSNTGAWSTFTGTKTGTNFTVHTFDVIKTSMNDTEGATTLYMVKNPSIDYSLSAAARTVILTKTGAGYNYTAYTKTASSSLTDINASLTLPIGYLVGVWDKATHLWHFWISGFGYDDYSVDQYDVVCTKIDGTKTWIQ